MAANTVVRARVSEDVKDRATAVLAGLGLTVSDVVRITLTRVAKDGALPFDLTPNKLTADTLAKSDRGEDLHAAADADDLFEKLGI
ncbi:MAG: antitoxin DinJ [Rhodospirillales bacterium]|jgi:DNA-damage-inducible protein J|nr:antitoxin DinJ [Rhodospirillales bacterium]